MPHFFLETGVDEVEIRLLKTVVKYSAKLLFSITKPLSVLSSEAIITSELSRTHNIKSDILLES